MITFILGGIWHGAGWTFIFWGFLHGLALVVHRLWKSFGMNMPRVLAWFITFNFINIAWVFFRAREWEDAVKVLSAMFSLDNVVLPRELQFLNIDFVHHSNIWLSNIFADKYILLQLLAALVIILLPKNSMSFHSSFTLNKVTLLFCIVLFVTSFLHLSGVHEFLYFNF